MTFIERDRYVKLIKEQLWDQNTILFLIGARQVGKTTLLKSLVSKGILEEETTLYVDGDKLLWKTRKNGDYFWDDITFSVAKKSIKTLIIDEAQYVHNIGIILKNLIDDVRWGMRDIKIIVSWSGTLNIFRWITDSLIWRKYIMQIFPFSFEEFMQAKWISSFHITPGSLSKYHESFQEYILYWWYPAVVLASSIEEKRQIFVQLLQDYIFKDIVLLLKEKEFLNFQEFLPLIASKVWSSYTLSDLHEQLNIKRSVLKKYLYIIENTFLIQQLSPWVGWKIKSEIKKRKKIYFMDSGFLRYLLWTKEWIGEMKGRIVENYVCNVLARYKKWYEKLSYRWSIAWGEIDFVLYNEFDDELRIREVKSWNKDNISKTMSNFVEVYDQKVQQVYITTHDLTSTRTVKNHTIKFLPYLQLEELL